MAKTLMNLVAGRKSVRKYIDKPLKKKEVESCIESARLAPSAHNIQPWRFVVFDDAETKKAFCARTCGGVYRSTRFIENAPVVVAILAKLDLAVNRIARFVQGTQYYLLDVGIAGEHLVLRARELGIGTCWVGWFNARRARKFLRLPRSYRVVSLVAMGYPAEGATREKPDLRMEDILSYNGWPAKRD